LSLRHATAKAVTSALAFPSDIEVVFFLSVPSSIKTALLSTAKILIYTPRNEHLGIVPLEAMLAGIPVLAANEGGPTETVVEGKTGWLRDVSDADEWTTVIRNVLNCTYSQSKLQQMGEHGQRRVKEVFSKEEMASRLEEEMKALEEAKRPDVIGYRVLYAGAAVLLGISSVVLMKFSIQG
jgi:alpha-1,3/alpha-1,6-mannosyltransferase